MTTSNSCSSDLKSAANVERWQVEAQKEEAAFVRKIQLLAELPLETLNADEDASVLERTNTIPS